MTLEIKPQELVDIENEILELVGKYYSVTQKVTGTSGKKIHYAGRCYDEKEIMAAVKNILKFTLTYGKDGINFEKEFSKYLGVLNSYVVNSGSSANLVAVSSLCSMQLKDLHLKIGDEIIVPAASFPTTVAPILQNGLIPVFIDTQLGFYNPDIETIRSAYSSRTRAVVFAHTLGNPAQIDLIQAFCKEKNIFLIEDCCDALGSIYDGRMVGTFGDLSTYSFYPAHHITMGEGGAVGVNNPMLLRIVDSLRSWGKDCWCKPGELHEHGACKHRFSMQFGDLPFGYDHKYVYTNIGYNLKPLDLQCSIGLEQLKKLSSFIKKRKNNFNFLYRFFEQFQDVFILPKSLDKSDTSWFAFPLTLKSNLGFSRLELIQYLEDNGIETRMLFAGNIVKQPAFKNMKYRIFGELKNSDKIMNDSFFIGVYPKLTEEDLSRVCHTFEAFLQKNYKNKVISKGLYF